MSLTRTKVTCAAAAGAAAAKRRPLIGTSSRPVATRRVISMGSQIGWIGLLLSAFPAHAELKVPSLRTPSCPGIPGARHPPLSFRGAAKRRARNPVVACGGYGFRAPSLRTQVGFSRLGILNADL